MFSAECHIHGAAQAFHCASSRPTVNVGGGAHSIVSSAYATHAGAFGKADVVADDTHAAGCVAAVDWLTANYSSGGFNASGTDARASDVDDGHFPGLQCCENSVSLSRYLHPLPDNDDDYTSLLCPHNAAPSGRGGDDGVDRGFTHACLHDDTQSDDDDDCPVDTIKELLGPISQREDVGCDDNAVDVSVGVCVGARVGLDVSGLSVSLGVGLGVGLRSRLSTSPFPRLFGSLPETWSLTL